MNKTKIVPANNFRDVSALDDRAGDGYKNHTRSKSEAVALTGVSGEQEEPSVVLSRESERSQNIGEVK